MLGRGYSFRVEKARSGLAGSAAGVLDGQPFVENFFSQFSAKEAVVLLYGVSSESIQKGSDHLCRAFAVYDAAVKSGVARI